MRSNLKQQLIHVLAKYPKTRDDDRVLMTIFYSEFFPNEFRDGWMKPGALERMANPDDLVRLRAFIQNELNLYLSRKADVRKRRRQSEIAWRNWILLSKNKTKLAKLATESI